jgi:hypothetical protein
MSEGVSNLVSRDIMEVVEENQEIEVDSNDPRKRNLRREDAQDLVCGRVVAFWETI